MSQHFDHQLVAQLPRLRRYALLLTRNHADADDLVQSAAVLALKAQSQFVAGTNFSAWTSRILRNKFLSNRRGIKTPLVSLGDISEAQFVSQERISEQVLAQEVIRESEKLSPVLRKVLALIGGAEMTYKEAALALSCSIGTVKSRMWRARKQMQALLLDTEADGEGDVFVAHGHAIKI